MFDCSAVKIIEYDAKYAVAAVRMWRDSKEAALGIKEIHGFDDHLSYLNGVLVNQNTVYLAISSASDQVIGLMATNGVFLNQLYIHVDFQRSGVGSRLLELAKSNSSGSLKLYTFEINHAAQSFYEKHGFRCIGGGNDNEERLRDRLYEWSA